MDSKLSLYPAVVNKIEENEGATPNIDANDVEEAFGEKERADGCCTSDEENDIEHIKDDIMLEYILNEMSEKLF